MVGGDRVICLGYKIGSLELQRFVSRIICNISLL
jgi:hypothetical protein